MQVEISKNEIEVLIAWHREQQWESAQRENYLDADDHKKRAEQLAAAQPVPNA